MHQYKILKLLFLLLLIYYLYKNTNHDICHHIFMYDERDKNTKYILNTIEVHKMKSIVTKKGKYIF